ncbi:MupG family TIM beta-alpha barrel fold protein [Erysipelotrichaceae bacterium HCN-30851]
MIKKEIGISVYPETQELDFCKKKIDDAVALGYTKIFTGFGSDLENIKLTDKFIEVFKYAKEKGLEFHVDFNNYVMKGLGMTCDNLKLAADIGIPVIRVDCGISHEDIITMTKNPYGIKIEENLSNINILKDKMEKVKKYGNMDNYCACHNFYPRINSGLDIEYAFECARIAKSYGCKTGAFIGSLYSEPALVANGKSTMTVEKHRYIPSHIQAMELFSSELFDFLIFGDGDPSYEEMVAVSQTTKNAYECLSQEEKEKLNEDQRKEYENAYCIQLPIYFENFENPSIEKLKSIVMKNRIDICEEAVRIMNWRGTYSVNAKNTIKRPKYSVTIDNKYNDGYRGEIEILLKDMPAVPYANVIGMVKPYAYDLVDIIRKGKVMFKFSEY